MFCATASSKAVELVPHWVIINDQYLEVPYNVTVELRKYLFTKQRHIKIIKTIVNTNVYLFRK